MKKLILASAAVMAIAGAAHAEKQPIVPAKAFDNYSITLKGGVATPLQPQNGSTFGGNMRGVAGLEVRKQILPALGVGIEGETFFNSSTWNHRSSKDNVVDNLYVGAFGAVNLNNLFAGYAGRPRVFEVEVLGGLGWIHGFIPSFQGKDYNDLGSKVGLNLNFNLGAQRAWTIGIKPSILFDMTSQDGAFTYPVAGGYKCYSKKSAVFELQAGVTYHFACSNGSHSFAFYQPEPCDFTPYNDQINALRAENAALAAANTEVVAANAALAAQLDECINRPVPVVTNTVVDNTLESVRYVYYRIGSSAIAADQRPNVEMIADYMKHNPASTVVIKGYASQDGNLDFNLKLAAKRAESVKEMLITKYGIKADRIKAEGQGIGHMFKEESWNRVAICILNEDK